MRPLFPIALLCLASLCRADLPVPYLCTVHYGTDSPSRVNADWLKMVNGWPMDGLWLNTESAYNEGQAHQATEFDELVATLKAGCRKDIWPAVYLNPVIQYDPAHCHGGMETARLPVLSKIRGWDLDDEAARRSAMLDGWRQQLRLARVLGSPGVAWDMEAYNNYSFTVSSLATVRNEDQPTICRKLEKLGEDIADVVMAEFADCVIWNLFSPNARTGTVYLNGVPWSPEADQPQALVEQGMLAELKARGFRGQYLDGGESSVGYVNASVDRLTSRLLSQQQGMAWLCRQYPFVKLGATIAPWIDVNKRSTWMTEPSTIRDIEAFQPFFRLMMANRDFSWLYIGAGIDVQSPEHLARLTPVLQAAKQEALADRKAGRVLQPIASGLPPLPPASHLADFHVRQPLTDFASEIGANRFTFAGVKAGNATRNPELTAEQADVGGASFVAKAVFPKSTAGVEEWPQIAFAPAVRDWHEYAGVALELFNAEDQEGYVGVSVQSSGGEWYKRWPVPPKTAILAVVPTDSLAAAADLRSISRVSLVMYTNPRDWTWRLSNLYLVR